MNDFECTIIGAGVVGLAVARKLSQKNLNVLVLEKNKSFGEENSSHNSGVIHAGIYYKKDSLKSKFCIPGNELLYKYAKERNIRYNKCGKLIVACNLEELVELKKIEKNAKNNGIFLKQLNSNDVRKIEPEIVCESALFSKNTGIIDVYDLMLNFVVDIENNGGIISYNSQLLKAELMNNSLKLNVKEGGKYNLKTSILVNCAGLNSINVSQKILGSNLSCPQIRLVKGNYMKLVGKNKFSKLVYPIPNNDGLGIHLTIGLEDEVIFGPDTVDVKNKQFSETKYIKNKFIKSIKKYWPEIIDRELTFDYCGIRTKTLINDFIIQNGLDRNQRVVNLYGIESPGLTSSIAIGEYISEQILKFLKK